MNKRFLILVLVLALIFGGTFTSFAKDPEPVNPETMTLNELKELFDKKITEAKTYTSQDNMFPGALTRLKEDIRVAEKESFENRYSKKNLLKSYLKFDVAVTAFQDSTYSSFQEIESHIIESDPTEKILKEGTIMGNMKNFSNPSKDSMANAAVIKPFKIYQTNKGYKINFTLTYLNKLNFRGFLGFLDMDPTGSDENNLNFQPLTPISYYRVVDEFNHPEKSEDPRLKGKFYPKEFILPVSQEYNPICVQVYVPVMEAIGGYSGTGTQPAKILLDWETLNLHEIVDKTPLKNKITEAESIDVSSKTEDTVRILKDAIIAGKGILAKEEATNDEVNTAISNINTGIKGLKDKEQPETRKYVKLKFIDAGVTEVHIRRMVDPYGEIIDRNGHKFLEITYYSKQIDSLGYDVGSSDNQYAYTLDGEKFPLQSKVIESGIIGGEYEISKAEIPIDNKDQVVLFGMFSTTQMLENRFPKKGTILWEDSDKTSADITLSPLKFLLAKQGLHLPLKEEGEPALPFDFVSKGKTYSPYTSEDGKKFKLNDGGDAVELVFERTSEIFNELRHVKFTIDGSEPTMTSKEADLRFMNKDKYRPEKFFSFYVDPLELPNFPREGGELTVKVKGFNHDGSKGTEILSFVLPYEAEGIDTIDPGLIPHYNLPTELNTDRTYSLYPGTKVEFEESKVPEMEKHIQTLAKEKSLTNPVILRISVLDKDNNPANLKHKNSWNSSVYPLAKLVIRDEEKTIDWKNIAVYEYKHGQLEPVSFKPGWKNFSLHLKNSEGFYIFGEKDGKVILEEAKTLLREKIVEAKKYENNNTSVGLTLKGEVEEAEKNLESKWKKAGDFLAHVDVINHLLSKLDKDNSQDIDFLKVLAKELIRISEQDILINLVTPEKAMALKEKVNEVKSLLNTQDPTILEPKVKALHQELDKLEYKYPVKRAEVEIHRYHGTGLSMANNVFEKEAKVINTPEKNYLVSNLKVMLFAGIRAHLLELSLFPETLDIDKVPVYSLNTFVDLNQFNKQDVFDKSILVDLGKEVKEKYPVRVDNDGMPGANPEAYLHLKVFEEIVNKKPLENKIAEAETLVQGKKTDEAFATLQNNIKNAKTALGDVTSFEEIKIAVETLQHGIDTFKTSPDKIIPVNKKPLEDAIAKAEKVNVEHKTMESKKVFADTLAKAIKLLQDPTLTQDQVNTMVKELEKAIAGLQEIVTPHPKPTPRPSHPNNNSSVRPSTNTVKKEEPIKNPVTDPVSKPNSHTFADTIGHWAEKAIEYVVEKGYFKGTSESTFTPNRSITRGEFVTVLGRIAKVEEKKDIEGKFPDVNPSEFYAPYVNWAAKNGIVLGFKDGQFKPNKELSREEMALMMSKYLKFMNINMKEKEELEFKDENKIGHWAKEAVEEMARKGIIHGMEDGTFQPKKSLIRAEVAQLLYNMDHQ